MTTLPVLGFEPGSGGLAVDLDRLVATRLAVYANSQGGKSYLLRGMMEGLHGRIQQVILDLEGEYYTLQTLFDDYVVLGRSGGDIDVDETTIGPMLVALLRANANIIVDLSEFKTRRGSAGEEENARDLVAAGAIDALMALPRADWRHLLVFVDEAQRLAPQKEATRTLGALADLSARGAKRGFGVVYATQRIASVNNELIAECGNKLVGFHSLGNDVKRAGDELGMTRREADALRELAPGEFYAYGPAFSREVIKVKTPAVKSAHIQHGGVVPPSVGASGALSQLIAQLKENLAPLALQHQIRRR